MHAEINVEKNEKPTDILYKIGKDKEASEKKKRSDLIKRLGNLLSSAQILYASVDDLKKIEKENKDLLQKSTEFLIGDNYKKPINEVTRQVIGKDTAGMLDIAHGEKMNDESYIKDAIELKNYKEFPVETDREYLKNKIEQQFSDYNFDINNIKGYYFKNNSEPSERIAQSKDFKEILKANKESILKNKGFSGAFNKHGQLGVFKDNNLKNAIGAFDVKNINIDNQGNLHLKIYDTYDFNKKADDFLNKAGRNQMEKGSLQPFFSIHDIIIPKNEVDEILK